MASLQVYMTEQKRDLINGLQVKTFLQLYLMIYNPTIQYDPKEDEFGTSRDDFLVSFQGFFFLRFFSPLN